MSDYGFSELECKIITTQIKRRAKLREEFLRLRTDPKKHASEAGFVFDNAIQRFISMKDCQNDNFKTTFKTARFTLLAVITPMLLYGYVVWSERQKYLKDCRCGRISYSQRMFKLQ